MDKVFGKNKVSITEIIELRKKGLSIVQIGDIIGSTHQNVSKILKKHAQLEKTIKTYGINKITIEDIFNLRKQRKTMNEIAIIAGCDISTIKNVIRNCDNEEIKQIKCTIKGRIKGTYGKRQVSLFDIVVMRNNGMTFSSIGKEIEYHPHNVRRLVRNYGSRVDMVGNM